MTATPVDTDHARSVPVAALKGFLLFLATLVFELPGALLRFILTKFLFWLFFLVINLASIGAQIASYFSSSSLLREGERAAPTVVFGPLARFYTLSTPTAYLIAFLPLVVALLTALFLPGGFMWTRVTLGARAPSKRERAFLQHAFDELTRDRPEVKAPSAYFVIDNGAPNAFVIGTTLYVHSGLLTRQHQGSLLGLVAHALAHRNSYDGRLMLATRRLVLPPIYLLSRSVGTVAPGTIIHSIGSGNVSGCLAATVVIALSLALSLGGGGFGLWLLNPFWVAYWREREYEADDFAKQLGADGSLRSFLEQHKVHDVSAPYFLSSMPSNELRIDRLDNGTQAITNMPWPRNETITFVSTMTALFLGGFIYFGGLRALGFGPRIERSMWILESVRSGNNSAVTTEQCHMQFDPRNERDEIIARAACFKGGLTYSRQARFSYQDADTIVIEPFENGNTPGLPIPWGGPYNVTIEEDQLIMRSALTSQVLTWQNYATLQVAVTATPTPTPQAETGASEAGIAENPQAATATIRPDLLLRPTAALLPTSTNTPTISATPTTNSAPTIPVGPTTEPLRTATPGIPVIQAKPLPSPTVIAPETEKPLRERILGRWQREDGERVIEIREDGTFIANGESYTYQLEEASWSEGTLVVTNPTFSTTYAVRMPGISPLLLTDQTTSELKVYYPFDN